MAFQVPIALEFVGGIGTVESKVVACSRAALAAEVDTMGKEGWRLSAVVAGVEPALAKLLPAADSPPVTLVFQRPRVVAPAAATPQPIATDKTVRAEMPVAFAEVSLANPRGGKPDLEPSFRADGSPRDAWPVPSGAKDRWSPSVRVVNKSGFPLRYATAGAIGLDLVAAQVDDREPVANREPVQRIACGATVRIPTGVAVELPDGLGALVQPRSGIAARHGVFAITGTIDRDYRGEIHVMLHNAGPEPFEVRRGDRIAQLVIIQAPRASIAEVDHELGEGLTVTKRGAGGFGSTGR
jgi:dUTP pyrophosphatase